MANFLKGALGGKTDSMIDKAVDQAACVAKQKVKTYMGCDVKGKKPNKASPGESGGAAQAQREQVPANPAMTLPAAAGDMGVAASADFDSALEDLSGELKS